MTPGRDAPQHIGKIRKTKYIENGTAYALNIDNTNLLLSPPS
jgi:hypothetical protein